jgi:hypothetical protein
MLQTTQIGKGTAKHRPTPLQEAEFERSSHGHSGGFRRTHLIIAGKHNCMPTDTSEQWSVDTDWASDAG